MFLLQLYAGFSISVMKADQAILDRLDAPTKAPNWPVGADGQFLYVYYCSSLCMGGSCFPFTVFLSLYKERMNLVFPG